jgi:hypothetical protein
MVELMVEVTVVPSFDRATGGRIRVAAAVAMLEKDEGAAAGAGSRRDGQQDARNEQSKPLKTSPRWCTVVEA